MGWPLPVPGMVIRYSFLWSNESEQGYDEGSKDRPCAVVVTTGSVATGIQTYVLPITHSLPQNPKDALEIPGQVKAHLGLDGNRSWIVLNEINDFTWPGFDLRPIGRTGSPVYGILPPTFFRLLRSRFLAQIEPKIVSRT